MGARAARLGLAVLIAAIALSGSACTCTRSSETAADASLMGENTSDAMAVTARVAGEPAGLSAPIAGARGEQGDVVVAGLDVAARSIHVQRISANDQVVADRAIFQGVVWSSESEIKVLPAGRGVAVTWRGLRGGKLVRQLLVLGADLAPQGEAVDISAAFCATREAFWFTDGKRVHSRPWTGSATRSDLPKDKDAALMCGAHRAFAVLEEDDGTSLVVLGGGANGVDGGARTNGGAGRGAALPLLRESDFGEDEQRERAEYTVGDEVGVVRLAISGALTVRELKDNVPGPLRTLKTIINRDDDVVAVDASPRILVVIYTEDVGETCTSDGGGASTSPSTRVKALRVDRTTFVESVLVLSNGGCGREVGPFFTGALGDAISVSWVERIPVSGKARAPVAGLAHRLVVPSGGLKDLSRIEQPADALVDAGCDGSHCYAVALARRDGMNSMVPGVAKILRY